MNTSDLADPDCTWSFCSFASGSNVEKLSQIWLKRCKDMYRLKQNVTILPGISCRPLTELRCTIRSYCDQLRCLLFRAAKHGCKHSPTFDNYSIPQYFVSKLALTQDEISHIAHYDVYKLPGRPQTIKTLERVRDTFVLCCDLGQRYSDIIRLCPDNFNMSIYKTIQKKTGSKAIVDIDKYAIIPVHTYRLLEKYGYQSPYKSTASNFDRYLHKLLRTIGDEFDQTITQEIKVNGVMMRESHKKWELCTSHTGRRSFIVLILHSRNLRFGAGQE